LRISKALLVRQLVLKMHLAMKISGNPETTVKLLKDKGIIFHAGKWEVIAELPTNGRKKKSHLYRWDNSWPKGVLRAVASEEGGAKQTDGMWSGVAKIITDTEAKEIPPFAVIEEPKPNKKTALFFRNRYDHRPLIQVKASWGNGKPPFILIRKLIIVDGENSDTFALTRTLLCKCGWELNAPNFGVELSDELLPFQNAVNSAIWKSLMPYCTEVCYAIVMPRTRAVI
jgi:hypothetical protein